MNGSPSSLPPGSPAPPFADTLRVLLAEDSPTDAELIARMLNEIGRPISLAVVGNRPAFEAELNRTPPHLILSDYCMMTFDGCTALQIATKIAPRVPFIFVTGAVGEDVAIEMVKKGATDYVLKHRLQRLVPAVRRALREAGQQREHEQAEQRLQRSHDQLRALTGHLQFVREEERTRIAREVHDELGQSLTGLKLDLAWLAGKLHGARDLRRKIKTMGVHIDETIHAIRRIATELRPGVLDNLGLVAAIEWQAAEFHERTGIRCETQTDVVERIWDRDFSTACFRIFQETLTNIARHAGATRVEVRLVQDDQELILTVRDNGRGISEGEVVHPRSIGLIGMRERAAGVGGEVLFFGLPARGTTVTMRLPLPALMEST